MYRRRTLTGHRLHTLRIALALVIVGGCGSETVGPPAPVTTVYDLIAINGHPLPAVLGENSTGKAEVLSESYGLEADGNYWRVQSYRNTDAQGVTTGTLNQQGTYVATSDVILFTLERDGGTYVTRGAVSGDRFTVTFAAQGTVLEYRKR